MHVSRAVANQQLVEVAGIGGHTYTLVVDLDLLVRFEIVPDQHLLFAADESRTHLHGRQPIHIYVRDDVIWEVHGDECDVLDPVQVAFTGGDHGFRLLAGGVIHYGEFGGGGAP